MCANCVTLFLVWALWECWAEVGTEGGGEARKEEAREKEIRGRRVGQVEPRVREREVEDR